MFEITVKNRTFGIKVDEKPTIEEGRVKFWRFLKNKKDKITFDYPYSEVAIVEVEGKTVEESIEEAIERKNQNPNEQ